MSENQKNSGEQDTSYEDSLEVARGVNETVRQMIVDGRELSERTFSSHEEAQTAAIAYLSECNAKQEADRAIVEHQFYATGDAVEVANMGNCEMVNGKLTIEFDPIEPYIAIDNPFESKTFTYMSFDASVMREDTDVYKIEPYLYGRDTQRYVVSVQSGLGMPMGAVMVTPVLRIPCSDAGIDVSVVLLKDAEECSRAIQELDNLPGEEGERAREIIQQLQKVVRTESQENFIDVEPAILHELGRIGASYALQDYKKSDVLNTAVKATLGDGRFVKLTGISYANAQEGKLVPELVEGFGGGVIDIMPDIPRTNDETPHGTTLVIERHIDGNQTIHYAAMTDITKLSI